MVELYLDLNKKALKETEEEAIKRADEQCEIEDKGKSLNYPDAEISGGELYFEEADNEIVVNGEICSDNKNLGYMSVHVPLNMDLVISIIESYRKKLAKLKNVLESVKP